MKKMALIMAMAALVCWLPGQALACLPTSTFTYNDVPAGSGLPTDADYGDLYVTVINSGKVTIEVNADNSPDMDFTKSISSLFFNVTGTVTSVSTSGSDATWTAVVNSPAVTAGSSGLGVFNISGSTTGSNSDDVIFTLYAASGTWSTAASVLAFNSAGFDAAANFTDQSYGQYCGKTGWVGEGSPVPIPPSALLLGSGLLGLVGFGWRKRS